MQSVGFLALLTSGLREQGRALPGPLSARHGAYVRSKQHEDGGFAGRRGAADPYYTNFGLNALHLLNRLDTPAACAAAGFLERQPVEQLGIVDLLACIDCCDLLALCGPTAAADGVQRRAAEQLACRLDALRRDDGGYANTATASHSSTYVTCLVATTLLLSEARLPDADWLADWLKSRQQSDGGFVELAPLSRGGTSPTALAVVVLRLLDRLDEDAAAAAVGFFRSVHTPGGGFLAHTRAPVADLLSTFTALVALENLDCLSQFDTEATRRFVLQLEDTRGGFRGGAWDDQPDVEYTYYALGSLTMLQ